MVYITWGIDGKFNPNAIGFKIDFDSLYMFNDDMYCLKSLLYGCRMNEYSLPTTPNGLIQMARAIDEMAFQACSRNENKAVGMGFCQQINSDPSKWILCKDWSFDKASSYDDSKKLSVICREISKDMSAKCGTNVCRSIDEIPEYIDRYLALEKQAEIVKKIDLSMFDLDEKEEEAKDIDDLFF